jgi:hypothetical protein
MNIMPGKPLESLSGSEMPNMNIFATAPDNSQHVEHHEPQVVLRHTKQMDRELVQLLAQ